MGDQDADAELVERLIAGNVADAKGIIDEGRRTVGGNRTA
jgi:hypothetical protein